MIRLTRSISLLLASMAVLAPRVEGQEAEPTPFDLATLFELGHLLSDPNGDSVPDFVNATLVLGEAPTAAEVHAATEIAARLGFETMALDLPLRRGLSEEAVRVVVGRSGLRASGVGAGVDPTSMDDGEGAVVAREIDGAHWVFVLGGDDVGLRAAARAFAGSLPHVSNSSSVRLDSIRSDIAGVSGLAGSDVRVTEVRVGRGTPGIERLVVEARGGDAALAALRSARDSEDEEERVLSYPGLASLEIRVGPDVVRLASLEPDPAAGPISGRPGSGKKASLDLSNLFTPQGLLGDSDSNLIPDRIDALLVPGASAIAGLPDLGARLGLESTGIVVPLVTPAEEVTKPGSQPTMVLSGLENSLITELADSGQIALEALQAGEGLIELVPAAFGQKPALVVTGSDEAGAARALEQVWQTLPNVDARGKDRPTIDDIEYDLWATLAGRTPAGQAAIALYKLDQIVEQLAGKQLDSLDVLVSLEKPADGFSDEIRDRIASLSATAVGVRVDNRDVQNADTIFSSVVPIPSEVERFWEVFDGEVAPAARAGGVVEVNARLSEPPAVRRQLEEEATARLIAAGADEGSRVTVLSAFKQGFSWLDESVRPRLEGEEIGEIVIRFLRNTPPEDWPQQAIYTPVRWLHEIYPIDEVLARDLDIPLERIRFEEVLEGPTYEVQVTDTNGGALLSESFEPRWVLRPYFDRFADYEHVRVTTGWLTARRGEALLADERIVTEPEAFWDVFQAETLSDLYDYVMDRHNGIPRGGSQDAPFFGELDVDVELSEPDYRLEIDNEIISPMDALHEEVYFGTIEFFHLLGRHSRGQDLTHPGRVLPRMRPKSDGTPGRARISLTGFATNRPAVVVTYRESDGTRGEMRLDIPKVRMERPSARQAHVRAGAGGLSQLALRVRVDTDADERERLLGMAPPERVDETMLSAAQVTATIENLEALRAGGMYLDALAYPGMGRIDVWAEWGHEQDPEMRRTASLAANGIPPEPFEWRALLADDFDPDRLLRNGERIVQWEEPIPPPEGHEMIAQMAATFDEATMYRAGQSYLGKTTWALDLMSPVTTTHWSHAKATTFKPTVIYSARQHANEVSSTSHVLRHAELLLTDPEQRPKLDRVNVVIHPFTNADGAQLAYDLYKQTPDYILHAGYLGSLGMDATSGSRDDHPIYPESKVRGELWAQWLPDIFLNPHGYPSHQVVQLFSEYTGLVRRGRVTERNWGFNKGWFMPGFGYVDDPEFPRHKDAAFSIRDYITKAINGNADVFELNQRSYARYQRYGAEYDADVFRIPLVDSVLIEMPLKGSRGQPGGGGYNPNVTIWSGTTEAPDETAYGAYMELVAKAGLSWDQAILDYLHDGAHEVKRSGSSFFGGVTLRMNRPRPPEAPETDEETDAPGPPSETLH